MIYKFLGSNSLVVRFAEVADITTFKQQFAVA